MYIVATGFTIVNSYNSVDSADTIVYVSVSLEVVVCRLTDYFTRDTGLTWWSTKPEVEFRF